MYNFYRVAVAVPDMRVADIVYNKNKIIEKLDEASEQGVKLIVFPELALSGYTCGDLFMQNTLIDECQTAVSDLVAVSSDMDMVIAVGAPVKINYQLYNACIVMYRGIIQGINVKTFIPDYNEFCEGRWFSSAESLDTDYVSSDEIIKNSHAEYFIPVGNDLIYNINNEMTFGAELGDDLQSPLSPSTWMALSGAELMVNLSASNDIIGRRDYRRQLIKSKSASLRCEYVYVSAGSSESSTDLIFSGHSLIAENGRIIKENEQIADNEYLLVSDIDLGRIKADRLRWSTFKNAYSIYGKNIDIRQIVIKTADDFSSDGSLYTVSAHPFIPSEKATRLERCKDIFQMQVGALAKRLSITGGKLVVGVSGGMDSTLALLASAQTLKKLGRPMTDLVGITMPAFGTTDRTYNNSLLLMETMGITVKTIPIKDACIQHYKDLEHDINVKDITFENVQARERTQVLMDYANKIGGIVVGTGDLSELALGWCTYNGDQMSMYGVNAGIPKTLVKWMIDSVVEYNLFPESNEALSDIIDTPISPELLPPDEDGNISQKTEDSVGPYELHDFFLYYMIRYAYSPGKIFCLAKTAFKNVYSDEIILKWMNMFYRRFFSQQFKRSCMPDGVKIGSVGLSPRGDWRMPSDASAAIWMRELETLS